MLKTRQSQVHEEEVFAECESFVRLVCHGSVCGCVFLPGVYRRGLPGTSLGSPTSVMTEDQQWLGVTSCGSPASEMCHQQRRPAGASLPVGCFSCVQAGGRAGREQTGWVDGWMDGCPSM